MEMEQLTFERDLAINNIQKIVDCSNNVAEFRVRVKELASIKKSFFQVQAKIEKVSAKNDSFSRDDNLAVRNQFDSLYFKVQVALDTMKEERKQSITSVCGGFTGVSHASCCTQQSTQSHIRLPRLSLQTFTGVLTEWNAFYDLFKSLVHDNVTLTNVERFRYLLLFLKDEPYNLIKSISVTDSNYENALQVLISRYENKRIISTKHFDNIFDCESVNEKNVESSLRNLMNCYHENITALKSLGLPVDDWNFVLLNILLRKITPTIRRRFELSLKTSCEIPEVTELLDFLDKELAAYEVMTASARTASTSMGPAQRAAPALAAAGGAAGSARSAAVTSSRHAMAGKRAMLLTRANSDVQSNAPRNTNPSLARNSRAMSVHATTATDDSNKIKCAYCKDNSHPLYKCEKFNTLDLNERKHFVEQNKLCTNCLFSGHEQKDCKSRHTCRVCTQRHHSLLHNDVPTPNVLLTTESSSSPELRSVAETFTPPPLHGATEHPSSKNCTVLLTTALVNVRPLNQGPYTPRSVRTLVDQGAQTTLISESCVQRLGLPRYSAQAGTTLTGIGGEVHPRGYVLCEVTPHNKPEPKLQIEAFILPNLTSYTANIPKSIGNIQKFQHLQNLDLADPELRSTRPVELLLGSDYLDSILLLDNIKGPPGTPVAINSIFGYLIGGRISYESMKRLSVNSNTCQLDMKLQRFWELESILEHLHLTKDELRCESIFVDTHTRDANGKYIVSLPFKENAPPLGDSRAIALSRLTKLEARLSRDPALRENYNKGIQEYLDLGHMEPVTDSASPGTPYYLPHHVVVKSSASTTKYRIVYDASCKTTSGRSLNDNLLTGQKLHQDISEILLKYRLHKIVFTADLKMMYRYIGLCKEHRDFHRILWRFSPHDPVKEYRMCSVTFGVASAPFLALRTLRQLAIDEAANFPLASQVLLNEVFVDDVVTGVDTVEDAITLQYQLTSICKAGTFELRKWTSNSSEFLSHLNNDASHHDDALILSALDTDTSVKVLGLKWNPKSDVFSYQTNGVASSRKCTKRTMLAEIAKIYDPLGFLSPVTVFVKHLIQLLWVSGSGWDAAPPQGICDLWFRFIDELPLLQDIALPRHVLPSTHQVSLHGFSDASEKAYAACVYIRVIDSNGAISTHLLIGKTKIAPLKRLTIPRLELCGAHLLSKLIKKVLAAYSSRLCFNQVYAWSDSTITLAWLRSSPDKWRTYVSNRIADTTSNVPASQWHHVRSADNPADPASRGVLPSQLNHQLWFTGPGWLSKNESEWPTTNVVCHTDEERRNHVLLTQANEPNSLEFIERFSSLPKMLRVISYMLRFINKCRKANSPTTKHVTVPETKQALSRIISRVQSECFSEDISRLKDDDRCTKRLQKLKPFLDDAGLLRVGGRINRANVPYDAKHQILLPKKHHFTNLLIDVYHKTHLHVGPQTLQFALAQTYWILCARDAVRMRTRRCVSCVRARPVAPQPSMAQLPTTRVRSLRPFLNTSVDFAGHFFLKSSKLRNAKIYKSYVCVFVCQSTKAIHLELVPDLSTESFLNALRRFISRRGYCKTIRSDCGRNFVGCDRYLSELYTFLRNESNQTAINNQLTNMQITWQFNPPYAPHFAGLVERAVGSLKRHLHRVIGTLKLTQDEFNTLICQIEAVCNSRPLCQLSNDPTDPLPLTPGHFLIGEPLTSLPEFNLSNDNPHRLVRWQVIQQAVQHFWKRWSVEYLHQLQPRGKWFHDTTNTPLREGSVVVLIDNTLPPLQWRLARVHQLHPGADGNTRVVTVRIGNTLTKRPVVKVCPLPVE